MTLNLLLSNAGRLGALRIVCTVKFVVKIVCYELIDFYVGAWIEEIKYRQVVTVEE